MKVTMKEREVQAFRIEMRSWFDTDRWPEWLRTALADDDLRLMEVSMLPTAGLGFIDGALFAEVGVGYSAHPGDWIIQEENGDLSVMSDADFQDRRVKGRTSRKSK